MKTRTMLMGIITMVVMGGSAIAQPFESGMPRGGDADGYYSRADQKGYYDHNGRYRSLRMQRDNRFSSEGNANYYRQGAYEQNCNSGNQAAGTIFGALAGGLIGSAASNGNGGAIVGGAVLGGLLGNTISKDISCESQPYAFRTYSSGLNGEIGKRYEWDHGQERGYFIPTREFRRNDTVCREFTETTYANGREYTRGGTSCRAGDGNWRFD